MDENTPKHIAVIMDGNGRWAQKHGYIRTVGHNFGTQTVRKAIEYCSGKKVQVLTLYAFSTENWKRPQAEINAIMGLLREYLYKETPEMKQNNVILNFIGDLSPIPQSSMEAIDYAVEEMKDNTGLKVNIALNYGGRADILRAVKLLYKDISSENKNIDEITEEDISSRLYTSGDPDPDLIIRTGDEKRISNFLTWQSAYSELYFTPTLWPDMKYEDFDKALDFYKSRNRRFGGLQS